MMWDNITVLDLVENGTDELGNVLYEMVPSVRIKGRMNAPKDEPIPLEGRDVTRKEHLFYLPKRRDLLPSLKYIEHKGQIYKVQSVESLNPRFTELRVVTYERTDYRS